MESVGDMSHTSPTLSVLLGGGQGLFWEGFEIPQDPPWRRRRFLLLLIIETLIIETH